MLSTIFCRITICQLVAEVQLTDVTALEAARHRFFCVLLRKYNVQRIGDWRQEKGENGVTIQAGYQQVHVYIYLFIYLFIFIYCMLSEMEHLEEDHLGTKQEVRYILFPDIG